MEFTKLEIIAWAQSFENSTEIQLNNKTSLFDHFFYISHRTELNILQSIHRQKSSLNSAFIQNF